MLRSDSDTEARFIDDSTDSNVREYIALIIESLVFLAAKLLTKILKGRRGVQFSIT